MVADLTLDKQILSDVVKKSFEGGASSNPGRMDGGAIPSERSPGLRAVAVLACGVVSALTGEGPVSTSLKYLRGVFHIGNLDGILHTLDAGSSDNALERLTVSVFVCPL